MRTTLLAGALLSALFLAACGAGEPGAVGASTSATDEPPPDSVPPPDSAQLYEADGTVLEQRGVHGPELCLGGVRTSLPPQCGGLPLVNWNWDAVEGEESAGGTTWGDYHVVGAYDDGVFTVTDVGATDPDSESYGFARDLTTSCPEPEGGWAAADPSRASDAEFSVGAAVAGRRPDYVTLWVDYAGDYTPEEMDELLLEGKPVLQIMNVVVTEDVAGAETAIREVWGGPLCVTQREGRTEKELVAIRDEAERFVQEELGLQMTWSAEGDVGLAAEVGVWIDVGGAGQAALDERYGPGMVRLFPGLTPVGD